MKLELPLKPTRDYWTVTLSHSKNTSPYFDLKAGRALYAPDPQEERDFTLTMTTRLCVSVACYALIAIPIYWANSIFNKLKRLLRT